MKNYLIILPFILLLSCGEESIIPPIIEPDVSEDMPMDTTIDNNDNNNVDTDNPNILLIIVDDVGLDAMNGYSEGTIKPTTPHLDKLMNNGLRFTNLWTNSVCSPTRASILTGKYGIRNGVRTQSDVISNDEVSLHSSISNNYSNALIGKWHLSGGGRNYNPEIMGIDHYAGVIGGGVGDYYDWNLSEDGSTTPQTDYVTTKLTDLAIEWTSAQTTPWFLWLAYNAPHSPFHLPPSEMHSQGNLPTDESSISNNQLPYYMAAIEAVDYQIGRLLGSMSEAEKKNTTVIFLGDNGTPGQVAQAPYSRRKAKGSQYQGGVNCPLIISGAQVNRTGVEDALINSSDLFATIATLTNNQTSEIHDSKDFSSLLDNGGSFSREYTYAEYNDSDRDEYSIRNASHKLIVIDGEQKLYNLVDDPYENVDLMASDLSAADESVRLELLDRLGTIRSE